MFKTAAAAMAALLALPMAAGAQTAAADPQTPSPAVVQANREANRLSHAQTELNDAANAGNRAQYAADMEAYRRSMRAHRRAVVADNAHYDHQQRAYADAMAAWRMQVRECKKGHPRACKAPTPNPADYY